MVSVQGNQGRADLLSGDVFQLEKLLPNSSVVRQFQTNRDNKWDGSTQLTLADARTLLDELRSLDQAQLDEKPYLRTATGGNVPPCSQKGIVEALIEFLEAEIALLDGLSSQSKA